MGLLGHSSPIAPPQGTPLLTPQVSADAGFSAAVNDKTIVQNVSSLTVLQEYQIPLLF